MTSDNDNWDPCPAGQLTGMVTTLRSEKRRESVKLLAGVGGGIGLIAAMLIGAIVVLNQSSPTSLTCNEVIAHFEDYQQGLLPADLVAGIKGHLEHCPSCQEHYAQGVNGNARAEPISGTLTAANDVSHSVLVASTR